MALSDLFLLPLGLLALLSILPLIALYLLRPQPETIRLPTLSFLGAESEQGGRRTSLDRLRRNLLLLLQLLALVIIAVSIAAPYVPVSERVTVEETVIVLDTSASMATQVDGTTRFDRARSRARDAITGTTSIVVTAAPPRVLLRTGTAPDAREALSALRRTDAPGDLRTAVTQASQIVGPEARIVVVSDFADTSDWRTAVQTARAQGLSVDLEQVGGGGTGNVGITDRTFSGDAVTATVTNFGDAPAQRIIRFAGESESLSLAPGDVATATFSVPPGGGTLRLEPGDGFPTDDQVVVAAPQEATVRVLLVTNDENRFLRTALSVIEPVDLTVAEPPTSVTRQYDVIIFSNVAPDRLLRSTVEAGRETVAAGGGVAITAQENLGGLPYGDLLLIEPNGLGSNPAVRSPGDDPITAGISFPPPSEYVRGELREGRTLVSTGEGAPLIAVASRDRGQILYYGYIEDASAFKYNYLYPVFWKRAVFSLAGRSTMAEINRETGDNLGFGAETTVETPVGEQQTAGLVLAHAGAYIADGNRYGVGLLSPTESDVAAPPLNESGGGVPLATRAEERSVPFELTPFVALGALGIVLVELAFLRRRGDL